MSLPGLTFLWSNAFWIFSRAIDIPFTHEVLSYQHNIDIDGGFKDAKIELMVSRSRGLEWLAAGVAGHVVVTGPASDVIFEGFINTIKYDYGGFSVSIGPLLDVCNRVSVVYTPYVDISVDPPETGEATETTIAEDTDSQHWYGIQEEIVSGGTLVDDATVGGGGTNEAEEIRDAYLEENKIPPVEHDFSTGGEAEVKITLTLEGYYRFFERYIYNSSATGYLQIPTKIQNIIAADPNSLFSSNYDHINDDTEFLLLSKANETDNRTAQDILEEMVSLGTANDEKTYIAVYEDRVVYYDKVGSEVAYSYIIQDNQYRLTDIYGNTIEPWNIRPGGLVRFSDAMPVSHSAPTAREEIGVMLITGVSYQAPLEFRLRGTRLSRVKQLLAKKGIGL